VPLAKTPDTEIRKRLAERSEDRSQTVDKPKNLELPEAVFLRDSDDDFNRFDQSSRKAKTSGVQRSRESSITDEKPTQDMRQGAMLRSFFAAPSFSRSPMGHALEFSVSARTKTTDAEEDAPSSLPYFLWLASEANRDSSLHNIKAISESVSLIPWSRLAV
jgi:hypothetical protein